MYGCIILKGVFNIVKCRSNFWIIVVQFSRYEKTLYAIWIPDANLYMVFFSKPRIGIQFVAFVENAANGVERRLMQVFS